MADLIKKIKIKKQDGTFTDYIPIGAEAKNISTSDGDSVELKLSKKPYYYNNVADMKANAKLKIGDMAITLGYYNANDGGGAEYVIVDDNTLVGDDGLIHILSNGLRAVLLIDNDTINFKQLGAKSDDNTYDNKQHLLTYQTICNNLNKTIKLIIPNGTWYFSPTHLSRIGGFNIEGIGGYSARTFVAPVICAINTQDYIWKFGGLEDMGTSTIPYANTNTGNNIKNLVFSTKEYSINYGCLVLEYANYGFYDKLFFNNIIGTGLYIRSSWENYFGMMNFRAIKDFSKPCFKVATIRGISSVSPNVSSSSFDKMIFESISGDLIGLELGSSFVNNQIGEINVEYGYSSLEGETSTVINSETDLSEMIPIFLINGNGSGITIDTINWTGLSSYNYYHTTPNGNYYFKSLFNSIGGGATDGYRYDFNIGKISSRSVLQILTSIEPYAPGMCFSFGNYVETSANSNIDINYFDLKNSGRIHYNSIKSRLKNTDRLPLNTIKISQNGQGGTLNTDDGALGNKICCSKSTGGATTILGFTYPYEYSDTKKLKALLRLKTTSEGGYYFILRGLHNDSNVNTTYSASNLEPNSWITIPIEMNYDFNSEIRTVNQNCLLDTLTFVSYE